MNKQQSIGIELMKPQIAWVIYTGNLALRFTARSTRRNAINNFLEEHCVQAYTWATLKNQGYSVQKVSIIPVKSK